VPGDLPTDSTAPAPIEPSCRNCGAPAPGAYCPACGQETQKRLPKFTQFLREAAGRYVALDGRLWRTLIPLLFRPGFLTREYLAGRRRRYIRPARLFLVASLFLFAVLHIVVELQGAEVLHLDDMSAKPEAAAKRAAAVQKANRVASEVAKAAEGAGKTDPSSTGGEKHEGPSTGLTIDDDFNVDLGIEIPTLKKRLDRFRHLSSEDKQAQIVDGIFRYGPYAMFVLLPAFGFLLKVLYLGRRRRYPERPRLYSEHLVFAAYNTAFLSLGIIAATVAPFGVLRAAVIVWIVVYLLWSMRTVYRGSWLGIAVRGFVIVIAYSVLFGLVTAGLVLAAVVLR
jgi:Protein of unknown function (DUF3667)